LALAGSTFLNIPVVDSHAEALSVNIAEGVTKNSL
jgi:hypothetical protein